MDTGVRGLVFDVQHFSVHDGPGIRSTVFLKGCPMRCSWCQNPESQSYTPELIFFADRCATGAAGSDCRSHCVEACPRQALVADDQTIGWQIDRTRCDACGRCIVPCGHGAMELSGQFMSVEELMQALMPDLPFYQSSGGGVTLSGGEPMQQPEFVAALIAACRAAGISVGVQTCGVYAPDAARILAQCDFVQFDIKLMDSTRHRELTGVDNAAILRHAGELIAQGTPVELRRPVLPGLNDTAQELDELARYLQRLGQPQITLLPYHRLGEAKLPRLGRPTLAVDGPGTAESAVALARAAQHLSQQGIQVRTC